MTFDMPASACELVDEEWGERRSTRPLRPIVADTEAPHRRVELANPGSSEDPKPGDTCAYGGRVYRYGVDGVWHDTKAPEPVNPKRVPIAFVP